MAVDILPLLPVLAIFMGGLHAYLFVEGFMFAIRSL